MFRADLCIGTDSRMLRCDSSGYKERLVPQMAPQSVSMVR
jgi:hypothetical protein